MARFYEENDSRYLDIVRRLLKELVQESVPFNVVVTGGEPYMRRSLVCAVLNLCGELMPSTAVCCASDDGTQTSAYKLGINSNGDSPASVIYRHPRLNYVDISFIDVVRDAYSYTEHVPVRLQTVYRHSIFIDDSPLAFVERAINVWNYDSVLFRQMVGEHSDKLEIFPLYTLLENSPHFVYEDYEINTYDLWVKYSYQNHGVYIKRQDIDAQRIFERINAEAICSLVVWPDGRVTKSWDYRNILFMEAP